VRESSSAYHSIRATAARAFPVTLTKRITAIIRRNAAEADSLGFATWDFFGYLVICHWTFSDVQTSPVRITQHAIRNIFKLSKSPGSTQHSHQGRENYLLGCATIGATPNTMARHFHECKLIF
jgi:hypothetical protein